MIGNGSNVYKMCCEDISLIENYEQAINDKENLWVPHHKLEIQDGYVNTVEELKMMNLYWKRPACELIWMEWHEHCDLHKKSERESSRMAHGKASISLTNKPSGKSEFGNKYFKHFGYSRKENIKQYTREFAWYNKHNKKCRWEV